MQSFDMALCEVTHRDCASDPAMFAGPAAADAVLRLHAGHGPECLQFLAAHAYVSEGIDDC